MGKLDAKTPCGIIDIGSNSIRLCVYEVDHQDIRPLKKVFDSKRMVGLALHCEDGYMSEKGIEEASKAVASQLRYAELVGCKSVCVFATAALRNCKNSAYAVERIEKSAGCTVDVVSGEAEAEFGCVGVMSYLGVNKGVAVDIGGGSTELSVFAKSRYVCGVSVPIGSLTAWTRWGDEIALKPGEFEDIRVAFADEISALRDSIGAQEALYGVGGTMRNLARLGKNLGFSDDKTAVRAQDVRRLRALMCDDPKALTRAILETCPARVHTLMPGVAILSAILDATGAELVHISKYGAREGYVLSRCNAAGIKRRK